MTDEEPPATFWQRAAPALITFLMLLWLIVGAALNAVAGDFPKGF